MRKIYLFLTPGKTDGRVHSQQGAPTTGNIIYWGFSQQTYVQTLLASLGVVKLKISLSVRRGRGRNSSLHLRVLRRGGEMFQTNSTSRHRIPSYTLHYLFPRNTFLQGHIIFSNLPASKNLPEEQIFWGTHPLSSPDSRENGKWQCNRNG